MKTRFLLGIAACVVSAPGLAQETAPPAEDSGAKEAEIARAEATIAEKEAKAKGIRKMREAMAGTGGRTRIKMRLAEALRGKRIVVVPSSGTGAVNINKLDINDLVRTQAAQAAGE